WLVRAGLACAGLVRQRRTLIALGLLVLAQVVLALVLSDAHVTPYSLVYWCFVPAGWLIGAAQKAVRMLGCVLTSFAFMISVMLASTGDAVYSDPSSLYGHILPLIGGYLLFSVLIVPGALLGARAGGSYSSSYSS